MPIAVEEYDGLASRNSQNPGQVMGGTVPDGDFLARLQILTSMNTMNAHFDIIPYLWQSCKT